MSNFNSSAGAAHATAGGVRRALHHALRRVQRFSAHHGIWAPGIRVVRNFDLRAKAWLIGLCVGLPLVVMLCVTARTEYKRYDVAQRRVLSLGLLSELAKMTHSASGLRGEAMRAELRIGGEKFGAQLAADQLLFDAFLHKVGAHDLSSTAREALDSMQARRRAMLAVAADASQTSLPGRNGPRLEALVAYGNELTLLQNEIARTLGVTADAPVPVQVVNETLHRTLPKLRWLIGRTVGVGAPAFTSNDRAARSNHLVQLATQATFAVEAAESATGYAEAQAALEPGLTKGTFAAIHRHLARAMAVADATRRATQPSDVQDALGYDRNAYFASGRQAVSATDVIESAMLASVHAWAQAQVRECEQQLALLATIALCWLSVSAYLLYCTYQVMSGGLTTLCNHLDAIGRGDLSQRPQGHGSDEIGRALKALGLSIRHMSELFGAVTQGVAAVSQASREVAVGNAGLSGRTGDVRSMIAQVSNRADACSSALDTCGDQVEKTAELIHGMRADGQRSRKAMSSMRERMTRLQAKSREIGQVVGLVEAVAYQTRLLSINASVEAARAGVAGKGFAVVAQEVRALAQRSQRAAQQISSIVSGSIEEIESGGATAVRADEAVRRNEEKIDAVDLLMREAVQLTRTGRSESQEVLTIARGVEESMAGNVRVIEQLAQASASLRSQGDNLKRSVQHFVFG